MTRRQMRTYSKAAVLIVLLLTLVVPTVAAAQDWQGQIEEAFLGPGERIDNPYELLFGVVLPFLLVFAIIHYALQNLWEDMGKETAVISAVLAMFPIPGGWYQWLSEILLGTGQILSGDYTDATLRQIPAVGNFLVGLPSWQQHAVIALGFGAVLTLVLSVFAGKSGASREIRKHEGLAIIVLTGAVWMAVGGFEGMAGSIGWLIIFIVGFYLIWIHLRSGGLSGMVTGLFGIFIIGWGLTQLPPEWVPGPVQEFGAMLVQGAQWVAAAAIVLVFLILVMIIHVGGGK